MFLKPWCPASSWPKTKNRNLVNAQLVEIAVEEIDYLYSNLQFRYSLGCVCVGGYCVVCRGGGQSVCAFSIHLKPLVEVLYMNGDILSTLGYKDELLFEVTERRLLSGILSEGISDFSSLAAHENLPETQNTDSGSSSILPLLYLNLLG